MVGFAYSIKKIIVVQGFTMLCPTYCVNRKVWSDLQILKLIVVHFLILVRADAVASM